MENVKKEHRIDFSKIERFVPYIGFALFLILCLTTTDGKFIAWRNMKGLLMQASISMVVAVGTTFVMAHGDLDFTNGGIMAFCMIVMLAYCREINPPILLLPISILVGAFFGAVVGFLSTKVRVMVFIVGMCYMRMSTALLYTYTTNAGKTGQSLMTPMALVNSLDDVWFYVVTALAVVIIGTLVFEYTKIGQYDKLIGANKSAAKFSGINVNKYLFLSFVCAGCCAGVAAFMLSIRTGGLTQSIGSYETNTLIALTLGGLPLAGGSKASMRAAVLGSLSFAMLNNVLTLWGVVPAFSNVVKGLVFLGLVLITSRQKTGTIAR